jgi:hypothetical protein
MRTDLGLFVGAGFGAVVGAAAGLWLAVSLLRACGVGRLLSRLLLVVAAFTKTFCPLLHSLGAACSRSCCCQRMRAGSASASSTTQPLLPRFMPAGTAGAASSAASAAAGGVSLTVAGASAGAGVVRPSKRAALLGFCKHVVVHAGLLSFAAAIFILGWWHCPIIRAAVLLTVCRCLRMPALLVVCCLSLSASQS